MHSSTGLVLNYTNYCIFIQRVFKQFRNFFTKIVKNFNLSKKVYFNYIIAVIVIKLCNPRVLLAHPLTSPNFACL